MSGLAQNLLLAVVWLLFHADFSLASLCVGIAAGFLAMTLAEGVTGRRGYARAAFTAARLAARFANELIGASLTLARDIVRRTPPFVPGVVRVEVPGLGSTQIALLANLISLTPGTLTIDADAEPPTVFVHALYAGDPAELRRQIQHTAALIRAAAAPEVGA
jgi:multicomponent Na+:H+ antiporter subunit E